MLYNNLFEMYRLKKGYDSRIDIASTPVNWEIPHYKRPNKKQRGTQARA